MNAVAAKAVRENFRACLVVYDIPTGGEAANPSARFKRAGVRINYSCWIVPLHLVPLLKLSELKGQGADVEIVEFAEGETDKIIAMAQSALRKEIARIRKQVDNTIETARKKYKGADEQEKYHIAYSYHKITEKRIKDALDSAVESAMAFDLTGDLEYLMKAARKAIGAMDETLYAEQNRASKRFGRGQ